MLDGWKSRVAVSALALSALIVRVIPLSATPTDSQPPFNEETYSCILCHSKVNSQYAGDIHSRRGITCIDCHGGDPNAFDVKGAKARSSNYRGKISKVDGVRLCASCHSSEEKMRQFGLSTDQYSQYLTSRHGKMLFEEGNTDVASCVDCHGVHDILPASDPSSKVFRKNLPYTCGKCHADRDYMAPYDIPTDQLDDFLESVHGIELIENNNRAVPECARCHGVHGARAPGVGEVYNVCGQCHPFIQEQFMKSPHFKAEEEGLIKGCVACHGNHKILEADSSLFLKTCGKCHDPGTEPYRVATEMKDLIDGALKRYGEGEDEVRRARLEGVRVEDNEMRMEEAHTLLINLMTSQHTVDLSTVQSGAAKATSIINNVITTLEHDLVSIRVYKLALVPVWLFIGGMIALFTIELKRKRSADGRDGVDPDRGTGA
jgi:hypothetical protein